MSASSSSTTVNSNLIAIYQKGVVLYEFLSEEDRIVAKIYRDHQLQGVFDLDPSYKEIEAIPLDYRTDSAKIVRWLVGDKSKFVPITIGGRVTFHQFDCTAILAVLRISYEKIDSHSVCFHRDNLWKVFEYISKHVEIFEDGKSLQCQTLKSLRKLFLANKLHYDVEDKQYDRLIELEVLISDAIAAHIKQQVPKEVLLLLLDLYQDILERLWLIPCLDPSQKIPDEKAHPAVEKSRQWLKAMNHDVDYRSSDFESVSECIKKALSRVLNPFSGKILEKIDASMLGPVAKADDSKPLMLFGQSYLCLIREMRFKGCFPFLIRLLAFFYLGLDNARATIYIETCLKETSPGEVGDELEKMTYHSMLGQIYFSSGRYEESIFQYEQFLSIRQNHGSSGGELEIRGFVNNSQHLGTILWDLFRAYIWKGNHLKIMETHQKLCHIAGSLKLSAEMSLKVGEAYRASHEEKAIPFIEDAIKSAEETSNHGLLFQAYGELSNIYISLNNNYKAVDSLKKALEFSSNDKSKRRVLSYLAQLYFPMARNSNDEKLWAEGKKCVEKFSALFEGENNYDLETVEDLVRLANTFLHARQCSDSKHMCNLIFKAKSADQKCRATAINTFGCCLLIENDYKNALEPFLQAKSLFLSLGNYEEAQGSSNNLAFAYFKIGKLDLSIEESIWCIKEVKKQEKKLVSHETRITVFEQNSRSFEQLEESLICNGDFNRALKVSDNRRSRALINALTSNDSYSVTGALDSLDGVGDVQQLAASQNTTFVVYSLSLLGGEEKRLFAWIISSSGELQHKLIPIESLEQDIEGFGDLLKGFPYNQKEKTRTKALEVTSIKEFAESSRSKEQEERLKGFARRRFLRQKLSKWYQVLIAPIEEFFPKDPQQTLTIVPDGFLAQLPFAAMCDADGTYLIEKHPISIAPSIKVLQTLEEVSRKREGGTTSSALIIGNPITSDPKSFGPLPIGEKEALDMADLFDQKEQVLIQETATVSRFIEQAPNVRWIFTSCHGEAGCKPYFDPHSVFEGQLRLSPDEKHPEGTLHSQQISSLNLKAELVFLSACYSGTGKVQQEGVIGNIWSFLAAGALSTVGTYWPVPESETTRKMVNCFYQHMLGVEGKPKLNKAQALQQAMLLGISEGKDKFEQWGAFYLSGLSELPEPDSSTSSPSATASSSSLSSSKVPSLTETSSEHKAICLEIKMLELEVKEQLDDATAAQISERVEKLESKLRILVLETSRKEEFLERLRAIYSRLPRSPSAEISVDSKDGDIKGGGKHPNENWIKSISDGSDSEEDKYSKPGGPKGKGRASKNQH